MSPRRSLLRPRRCSPTQLRAQRVAALDRSAHARRGAKAPEAAPLPCHWAIAPRETPALPRSHEAVRTGHRWGAVPREEWPTDEKEVRPPHPPAAQRAQLTLHAAAQVAEILKDYADDEMGDRRQVCASHAPGSLPATPPPWRHTPGMRSTGARVHRRQHGPRGHHPAARRLPAHGERAPCLQPALEQGVCVGQQHRLT